MKNFEKLLLETKIDEIENLIEFIRKSDFYTSHASTRFHGSYNGGLLEYSLNLFEVSSTKRNEYGRWNNALHNIEDDLLVISALLHDLCKTYYYTIEIRRLMNNGCKSQAIQVTIKFLMDMEKNQ